MENFGFFRVAGCVPNLEIANVEYNYNEICSNLFKAKEEGASLVVFPELCITSCSCGDMFFSENLLNSAERAVLNLARLTKELKISCVVGVPVRVFGKIFNCAAFLGCGKILGLVPKISTDNILQNRWFCSAKGFKGLEVNFGGSSVLMGVDLVFKLGDALIGIELCEDVLVLNSPARQFISAGVNLVLNLAALERTVKVRSHIELIFSSESFRQHCNYICCFAGALETTTDSVNLGFLGVFEDGEAILKKDQTEFKPLFETVDLDLELIEKKRQNFGCWGYRNFETRVYREVKINYEHSSLNVIRRFNRIPFNDSGFEENLEEIFRIQVLSLVRRVKYVGCSKLVVGVSGGLDSTLALLVSAKACKLLNWEKSDLIAVTMPGFGTSAKTLASARNLAFELCTNFKEIDIKPSCIKHFKDIGHRGDCYNLVFENAQARERAKILLDIANGNNGLVVGSANMSELALGFTTFGGDHISMYCVNIGVPKTLVRELVKFKAKKAFSKNLKDILNGILNTPISPELLPLGKDGSLIQKTEEFLGEYVLLDFFLYYFIGLGFSVKKIKFLAGLAFGDYFSKTYILKTLNIFIKRFFSQQFKRSCLPDGPKIFSLSLSPRSGFKLASDCSSKLWLKALE